MQVFGCMSKKFSKSFSTTMCTNYNFWGVDLRKYQNQSVPSCVLTAILSLCVKEFSKSVRNTMCTNCNFWGVCLRNYQNQLVLSTTMCSNCNFWGICLRNLQIR